MLKKMISVIVALVLVSGIIMPVAEAEYWTVLYSWDGTQKAFPDSQVEGQLTVGWYRVWPVEMFDREGARILVSGDVVGEYSKLGWREHRYSNTRTYLTDSGELMYTPRDADVIYQNHNWYSEEPVCIYNSNGQHEMYVPKSQAETYISLGWFNTPPQKMWAEDCREMYVEQYEIELYKSLGWNSSAEYIPVKLYSLDGREIFVKSEEVGVYSNLGWYTEKDFDYKIFEEEAKRKMTVKDYEGIYELCDKRKYRFDNTEFMDDFYNIKYKAREAWRKQAGGTPIVWTGYQNVYDEVIQFKMRNISYKPISVVFFDFVCNYNTGNHEGIENCYDYELYCNGRIYNGVGRQVGTATYGNGLNIYSDKGIETDEVWNLVFSLGYGKYNPYKISSVTVKTVIFMDGTIWTNY